MRSTALGFLLLCLQATSLWTEDAMITDRPDQTESAAVVGKGKAQIEAGWLFRNLGGERHRVEIQEVPGTLARVGLSQRFELRVGWVGFVAIDRDIESAVPITPRVNGIGDADLGCKVRLADEKGARPEIAVLAGTSLPIGDDELTTDRADPSFRLSLAHTLSERLSLGYNLGVAWESSQILASEHTTLSRPFYTVALGITLNDWIGSFVELYGDASGSAGGPPNHLVDAGLTFLFQPNLQFDVAAGKGLNDAADEWFVGIGLSVRLPE